MQEPPDFMLPAMMSIERTVLSIYDEFPRLVDKDVEWVYERLMHYFRDVARGRKAEEPLSGIARKQALSDEILNVLEEREEAQDDTHILNNPKYLQGENIIPSLAHFYSLIFKRLRTSSRNWRKKNGPKGYLSFIEVMITRGDKG